MFELDARLQTDTVVLGRFDLSLVLLSRDSNYPWCILVPQRVGVREIFELVDEDQQQLWRESAQLSQVMVNLFTPDKMNLATIGNMVPQLHMHHIARFNSDPAWPKPVWGFMPASHYKDSELSKIALALQNALAASGFVSQKTREIET